MNKDILEGTLKEIKQMRKMTRAEIIVLTVITLILILLFVWATYTAIHNIMTQLPVVDGLA